MDTNNSYQLLNTVKDGGKITPKPLADALLNEACTWYDVQTEAENNPDKDIEDIARDHVKAKLEGAKDKRGYALQELEYVEEVRLANNQVVDDFMCNMLNGIDGLKYYLFCLPIWFAYHNPDVKVSDIRSAFPMMNNKHHFDDLPHPLLLSCYCTMDKRHDGRDNWGHSSNSDEFQKLTCGEVFDQLKWILLSYVNSYPEYLKALNLPGIPFVDPMEYETILVPKKGGAA